MQASFLAAGAYLALRTYTLATTERREARDQRRREREEEQLRLLIQALDGVRRVISESMAGPNDFDVARAEVAAAVALNRTHLPACEALVADGVPKPPYAMNDDIAWNLLGSAVNEVIEHARSMGQRPVGS